MRFAASALHGPMETRVAEARGEHWMEWWWIYLAIGEFNDSWLVKKGSTKSVIGRDQRLILLYVDQYKSPTYTPKLLILVKGRSLEGATSSDRLELLIVGQVVLNSTGRGRGLHENLKLVACRPLCLGQTAGDMNDDNLSAGLPC